MPGRGYLRRPLGGAALLAGQLIHAARRSDLPSLHNQDPSGVFGRTYAPPVRFVLLGDSSITAPGVEPLDLSWPRRIAHGLTDRFRVELVSVAVGGAKARDVVANQLEPALATDADIALVGVGANDALRGTPIRRFEHEVEAILARLEEGVGLVGVSGVGDLGTLPRLPHPARGVGRVRGRSIDSAIRRAAAHHPGVVKGSAWGPAWAVFDSGDPAVFAGDRFHASAAGHAVFAAAMAPVVAELVDRLERARGRGHAMSDARLG